MFSLRHSGHWEDRVRPAGGQAFFANSSSIFAQMALRCLSQGLISRDLRRTVEDGERKFMYRGSLR